MARNVPICKLMKVSRETAAAVVAALVWLPGGGRAQVAPATADSGFVTSAPGPQYRAHALTRAVLGAGWRDVWAVPVRAPVLHLETYAGGLTLEERKGGAHTLVLHLIVDDSWPEYHFRSVDKDPLQAAPPALRGTLAGRIFRDQTSALLPAAPLLVHPLLEAVGVLRAETRLYSMGDSPRLEHMRDTVAGMLGTLELKGQEAPNAQPGFAGSRSVKGTPKFLETLDSSQAHRLDEREFLAARLIDLLVNDPDRTPDNYDWARFGEPGSYSWRPLPRDQDYAFMDVGGLFGLATRPLLPKLVRFGPDFSLAGLTYSTHELDRRLLQRLSAADFHRVALRVQRAVTDSVIARAVDRMPLEWRERTSADERITRVLRARRDRLVEVAMEFYRALARDVDVHATDEADRLNVVRHDDGRVTVTITAPDPLPRIAAEPRDDDRVTMISDGAVDNPGEPGVFFARTFLPGETREVRLYAKGGNDVAVVHGAARGPIRVRVIGGHGDDVLADSTGGAHTFLYDAEGTNLLLDGGTAHVDTRPWKPLHPQTGFRAGSDWHPDWGGGRSWGPTIDYNTGSGLILGVGPRFKSYGFRRLPNHWAAGANLLVGTGNGRVGLTADAEYNFENSPRSIRVEARASQLEATRFFGFGNNTPFVGSELNLIDQNEIMLEPALVHHVGWRAREEPGNVIRGRDSAKRDRPRSLVGELRLGSMLGWIEPEPHAGSPLTEGTRGSRGFGLAGASLGFEMDRTNDSAVPTNGWTAEAEAAAFPAIGSGANAFATARADGTWYLPLSRGVGPHIALRAGGALATGAYPAQFSAAIGGQRTLRGYTWRRYSGDAAANGSAELRVPVGTVNLLVRSQLGVFVLSDAGRVWFGGRSDGAWHTSTGGGFWLSALGRSVSVAYAFGEQRRIYVRNGLFY